MLMPPSGPTCSRVWTLRDLWAFVDQIFVLSFESPYLNVLGARVPFLEFILRQNRPS